MSLRRSPGQQEDAVERWTVGGGVESGLRLLGREVCLPVVGNARTAGHSRSTSE